VILRHEQRATDHTIATAGARLGRDPSCEIAFTEEDALVSAFHARVWQDEAGAWWVEDLGSTNGTWLNGRRIGEAERLQTGARLTLGQRGPALRVTVPGQLARTQAERAIDFEQPVLRLRRVRGGEDLTAHGRRILIGRGADCTVPLRTVVDTVVSKHHAMIEVDAAGLAVLSDLGSRNGTFLNGEEVHGPVPLRVGDRVMLGWEGPVFEVRLLAGTVMADGDGAPYQPHREPKKTLTGMVQIAEERARRPSGLKTAVFLRNLAHEAVTESSLTFRIVTAAVLMGLVGALAFVWRSSARRTAEAERRLAQAERTVAAQARSASEAQRHATEEMQRLRQELDQARRSTVSRAVVDSLARRLRDAEARAAAPTGGTGTPDFTQVARDNRGAVGLVVTYFAADSVMGSGFAVTPSGYFITNRHVVQNESGEEPRTITVVMAETNTLLTADVVTVSALGDQDIAVLRIRGYRGPFVRSVDWTGRTVQQGAPAVMLGFPFGTQLALDPGGYVHASLFGGYIAQTGEWIRFSGNTYAGVSGSPVFSAAGAVVAVHFGAPREGPGLGISVPMSKVRRWLPAEARAELGL
jgi:pSer/pThr/pTyr-binding forkhead associated (FHA) protein/S1-C subfamily serine protease